MNEKKRWMFIQGNLYKEALLTAFNHLQELCDCLIKQKNIRAEVEAHLQSAYMSAMKELKEKNYANAVKGLSYSSSSSSI